VDCRLLFEQIALDDLGEIIGYSADDDNEAASRFGNHLHHHIEMERRIVETLHFRHASREAPKF
jgi:hypothetical protein